MNSSTSTTRPERPGAQRPIVITLGDPAGIGPEIVAKAFRDAPTVTRGCFVAGDTETMRRANQALAAPGRLALPVASIDSAMDAQQAPPNCIPVFQATEPSPDVQVGRVGAAAGRMAAECVVWAARAALRGEVAAIVTAPLHKEALAAAGYAFAGHTELLQAEAAAHMQVPIDRMPVRMMLANDELRCVLVSIHLSLADAIAAISQARVLETLRIAQSALQAMLGRKPRIAVAGLNPHAGEGGLFGSEEAQSISPAIAEACAEGIDASGPHAPDTVFLRARTGEFDAVIAMYHDQGLIPVKYLGVDQGVNVTLGLPLVRTSPDHGTAFDIAGFGKAEPASLINAIRMARRLAEETR